MSDITNNPVLAGIVAAFNTDENKAIAAKSQRLVAIASPEKVTGSSYAYFYGREDNDEETNNLLEKYRQVEEAIAKIKAALDAKRANTSTDSDMTVEEAKAELAAMQDDIKKFNATRRQMIKTVEMLGTSEEDIEAFKSALVSAGRVRAGGGSGTARVRWDDLTVNGETVKNFTEAAKRIGGFTSAELTAAMLKHYGTDEWTTIRDNDRNVEFTVTDSEGKEYTIAGVLAEPKAAPATKGEDEDSNEDANSEPSDSDLDAIEAEDDDDEWPEDED